MMNEYDKQFLLDHWKKPGHLKALLKVLPMTPDTDPSRAHIRVVTMTGIGFGGADRAQLYYLLEQEGILVRDNDPAPAAPPVCAHVAEGEKPCRTCAYRWERATDASCVRYRLAKDIESY